MLKNAKVLFLEVVGRISLRESREEIDAMVAILLEHLFGLTRTDVMTGRMVEVTPRIDEFINTTIERINGHEPLQYILGETVFYERRFQVNPSVLIPRPETEELVRTVLEWADAEDGGQRGILDIGTGSGCIAVTLKLECPQCDVFALDVSRESLEVARGNARLHNAEVNFVEHDILANPLPLRDLDVVVSNPPYITEREKATLAPNVAAFEPHLALFVPDDDPLLFYRVIAERARPSMKPGGLLAVEIHERYGREVRDLFAGYGWRNVEVREDVSGKSRVVLAVL